MSYRCSHCREVISDCICVETFGPLPPAPTMTKKDVLEAAIKTVADRGVPYGGVEDNFGRIAALWTTHMRNRYAAHDSGGELDMTDWDGHLDVADVAMMMALMKIARLENAPDHMDSWIDIAGYAACGGDLAKKPNSA